MRSDALISKKQNYGLTIKSKWQNINVIKEGRRKGGQFLNTFVSPRIIPNSLSFLPPLSQNISIPKKCLKFSIFSLPRFTIHKYPPKYISHSIDFVFPVSQYILIPKKYLKFSCFYLTFNNTFLSPSWILSGLLHCAHPICLMLCLSGSRSYSKIIEQVFTFKFTLIFNIDLIFYFNAVLIWQYIILEEHWTRYLFWRANSLLLPDVQFLAIGHQYLTRYFLPLPDLLVVMNISCNWQPISFWCQSQVNWSFNLIIFTIFQILKFYYSICSTMNGFKTKGHFNSFFLHFL